MRRKTLRIRRNVGLVSNQTKNGGSLGDGPQQTTVRRRRLYKRTTDSTVTVEAGVTRPAGEAPFSSIDLFVILFH